MFEKDPFFRNHVWVPFGFHSGYRMSPQLVAPLELSRSMALLRKFMEMVPGTFEEKLNVKILNGDGKCKIGDVYHDWRYVCQRIPAYFEIVLTGKPVKDYSSMVFNKLLSFYPNSSTKTDFHKVLKKFLRDVDAIAPPVMVMS